MQSHLYVSLSAQIALQNRMDTLANNIANVSTSGFRADEISFEQIVSRSGREPTSFVSRGENTLSLKSGEFSKTGNPLDVAIRGASWLAIQSGERVAYTRDGRLTMSDNGTLTNLLGEPVLDSSGSPVQLNPNAGAPQISADGTVTQAGRRAGVLGLFVMPPEARLSRAQGAAVITDIEAAPELDFNNNGLIQGYLEKSNVSPVHELTRLIALQRAFESVATIMHESELAMQEAARSLLGT